MIPNPGSNEAIELGCVCGPIDNNHGWGYWAEGVFAINGDCPLHGQEVNPVKVRWYTRLWQKLTSSYRQ